MRGGGIRDNDAQTGGGIRIRECGAAVLLNTLVSGNEAGGNGGGISHAGTMLRVDFTRVQGNTAGLEGGIYEGPGSQVSLSSSLVFNNTPNNCRPVGAVTGCTN